MFDWFREWMMMRKRGLTRCRIVELTKRAEPIDVTKFLSAKITESREISSTADVMSDLLWVRNHIKYASEEKDYWKFADETIRDGFGDCEDGAILLARLLLDRKFEIDSTGKVRLLPYHQVLVNVYLNPPHVAVTIGDGDELRDWTNPSLKRVPSDWKLWYCFNRKHAYTTKENASKWRKLKQN